MKSALKKIPEKIQQLIENHADDLKEAWANRGEDNPLSISFPVKIGFKKGRPICQVGIKFSKEDVTDSTEFEWNDSQLSLLSLPDVKSVTLFSGGKSVVLEGKAKRHVKEEISSNNAIQEAQEA